MRQLGYSHVDHYPGGLTEWFADARPIPSLSSSPPAVARSVRSAGTATSRPLAHTSSIARFIDALADRPVGRLFRLWAEIVLTCGVLFWLLALVPGHTLVVLGEPLPHSLRGLVVGIYFSAVTATSVGYGDVVPMGLARVIAISEAIAGLVLFGCVVSKFVSRRQDELIGEIHRIAFEDRLGRVRTNLHLVRTEIQETARLCEGRDVPPPEALARVESASMIFVGELRAVHDLLYRTNQPLDEAELETILTGVVSVFREFAELLVCVQSAGARRTAALTTSLAAMTQLAREICGDCVPRELAPALKTWMDEIQRMAADVEQI